MASTYSATVHWQCDTEDFCANKYSRVHRWDFDNGVSVTASASPHIVPAPWSSESAVDPEEAFVASLSSCHMLFFLSIAAEHGLEIASYTDTATGTMKRNAEGKIAITEVVLHPRISCRNAPADVQALVDEIHHDAHEKCFIANSVNTVIRIESSVVE